MVSLVEIMITEILPLAFFHFLECSSLECLQMYDKAVKLYAELAEVAVNSFLISKDSPVIEPVRIHNGAEENKEALRKSRGEEDEDFQILEYQAQKGNAGAMYKIGIFYYFGLRGVRRDHAKALSWFLKAVEKGEPRSMELLGEIYARGAGVERNYTKAFEWLKLASRQQLYSAYNGMGYLYVKGYGVEKKNYTKVRSFWSFLGHFFYIAVWRDIYYCFIAYFVTPSWLGVFTIYAVPFTFAPSI